MSKHLNEHIYLGYDVPKYLINQIYNLLLLVIEYSRVNCVFFHMYIADFK